MGGNKLIPMTDTPCRRNLKQELARLEDDKKWILKNRPRFFSTLDMYEKFYEALGRAEVNIIVCKEDMAQDKQMKRERKKARKEQKAAQKELAELRKNKEK